MYIRVTKVKFKREKDSKDEFGIIINDDQMIIDDKGREVFSIFSFELKQNDFNITLDVSK